MPLINFCWKNSDIMQAISKVQHLIIIERYNANELAVNEQNIDLVMNFLNDD